MIGVGSEHDGGVDVLQIEGTKLFDFFQDLGEALEIFLDPLLIQRDAEDIANEVGVSHLSVLSILSLAFGPLPSCEIGCWSCQTRRCSLTRVAVPAVLTVPLSTISPNFRTA